MICIGKWYNYLLNFKTFANDFIKSSFFFQISWFESEKKHVKDLKKFIGASLPKIIKKNIQLLYSGKGGGRGEKKKRDFRQTQLYVVLKGYKFFLFHFIHQKLIFFVSNDQKGQAAKKKKLKQLLLNPWEDG